jgi:hypothetical protein
MRPLVFFLLFSLPPAALVAQDQPGSKSDSVPVVAPKPYRDPHKARVFGTLFPGAGHIYAGEYLRGYGYYVGTIGGVGMGTIIFMTDRCTFSFLSLKSCNPGPQWPHQVAGIVVVATGIWSWVSSARDAPAAARRANLRHEAQTSRITPLVEPVNQPNAGLRAGLNISW